MNNHHRPNAAVFPNAVSTPAELVAQMRRLKERSGLTYRQIAARAQEAGDFLPSSTLAGALARQTLPREGLLKAFVRACTRDEELVQSWVHARTAVAAGARQSAPLSLSPVAGTPPSPLSGASTPHRRSRPLLALMLATACGTAAWRITTGVHWLTGRLERRRADGPVAGSPGIRSDRLPRP